MKDTNWSLVRLFSSFPAISRLTAPNIPLSAFSSQIPSINFLSYTSAIHLLRHQYQTPGRRTPIWGSQRTRAFWRKC